MMGIGGRAKTWGRVLLAGLNGDLPGGFRRSAHRSALGNLRVHPLTARGLIMGGPDYVCPFRCLPGDLADWQSNEMKPGEVCRFLNCVPDDMRWLKTIHLLSPINPKGTATKFDRKEVDALGQQLITTREMAARRGFAPSAMRELLETSAENDGLGQGFYRRAPLEEWIV